MNADIKGFIEASKKVQALNRQLALANTEAMLARKALSAAFFEEGSKVPASFVVRDNGTVYLIRIDTEGDHGHTIEELDAIIENEVSSVALGPGATCKCGCLNSSHNYGQCDLCDCQGFIWVGAR